MLTLGKMATLLKKKKRHFTFVHSRSQPESYTVDIRPIDEIMLRLLLNWRRDMRGSVCRSVARAAPIRLGSGGFGLLRLIIVVLVHIHVASSRLMLLRSLLFGRL